MDVQRRLIRKHLESGLSITPKEARELYSSDRLGARIWELRHQEGLKIHTDLTGNGRKKFATYTLIKENNGATIR